MKHRHAARAKERRRVRQKARGPRARRCDHQVGRQSRAVGQHHAHHAPAALVEPRHAAALQKLDAAVARPRRQARDHLPALDEAAHRVKSSVDEAGRVPRRKARGDGGGVDPLGPMSARRQRPPAFVLEAAGGERRLREKQHAGLVIERRAPLAVPAPPAVERALGQLDIVEIAAVLEPHDLADVGRRRQRMRDRPRVDDAHAPPAPRQLDGGAEPEHAGANDDDHHLNPIDDDHHLLVLMPSSISLLPSLRGGNRAASRAPTASMAPHKPSPNAPRRKASVSRVEASAQNCEPTSS